MKRRGFDDFDGYTFGSILKGIACAYRFDLGQQVHSMVVKMGYVGNVYSSSALLDMYAKCERVEDAYVVFQSIPERNSVTWNALIAGYVQVGDRETAFWLLDYMEWEGIKVDDGTFAPLLTLLDDADFYRLTMQIHCKIVKHGLVFHNTVCNALITSYSECGSIEDAKRVFDGAVDTRDLVTWNSLLAAYLVHNKEAIAFELFMDMQGFGHEPDIYTYTSVVSACFDEAHKNHGKSLQGLVIKRGLEKSVPISNALISMYLKSNNRCMEDALLIFDTMELKDRVSWNSILTGFSQLGFSEDTVKFFGHMRSVVEDIDHYAFSAVLRSCSDIATLQLGQQVHVLALKSDNLYSRVMSLMGCGQDVYLEYRYLKYASLRSGPPRVEHLVVLEGPVLEYICKARDLPPLFDDFDGYTFGSILEGVDCAHQLDLEQQVHSMIVKMGYVGNVYSCTALLDMYAKCCIERDGVKVNDGTFAPVLTLLDDAEFYKLTMQIHCKIVKHWLCVILDMCERVEDVYVVFQSLPERNSVFMLNWVIVRLNWGINPGILIAATQYQISGYARTAAWIVLGVGPPRVEHWVVLEGPGLEYIGIALDLPPLSHPSWSYILCHHMSKASSMCNF
nr:putative pentatricopeptide repeat-containing protein [Quercus suber]